MSVEEFGEKVGEEREKDKGRVTPESRLHLLLDF